MKSFVLLASLLVATTVVVVDSAFILGGALIAGAIALKIAAGIGIGAGLLIGSRFGGRGRGGGGGGYGRGRYGRSPLDVDEVILSASLDDSSDCAKKLVCMVNAQPVESLGEQEKAVYELFGDVESLDVSKDSVEFELAALMGRKVGVRQCAKIYARCPQEFDQLVGAVREQFKINVLS